MELGRFFSIFGLYFSDEIDFFFVVQKTYCWSRLFFALVHFFFKFHQFVPFFPFLGEHRLLFFQGFRVGFCSWIFRPRVHQRLITSFFFPFLTPIQSLLSVGFSCLWRNLMSTHTMFTFVFLCSFWLEAASEDTIYFLLLCWWVYVRSTFSLWFFQRDTADRCPSTPHSCLRLTWSFHPFRSTTLRIALTAFWFHPTYSCLGSRFHHIVGKKHRLASF